MGMVTEEVRDCRPVMGGNGFPIEFHMDQAASLTRPDASVSVDSLL
jgi:hypothetical protein